MCVRNARCTIPNMLQRHVKSIVVVCYCLAAAYELALVPWVRILGVGLRTSKVPVGFHFLWEYAALGYNAQPAYDLMLIEQLVIAAIAVALYHLATLIYDMFA
jgi:hypothetical protein